MARGPVKENDERIVNKVKFYEKQIDKILEMNDDGTGSVSVGVKVDSRLIMKILRKKYEEAGWKSVNFRSEQGEDDWIEFNR